MADWNECNSCETEFQVISSNFDKEVNYCPFCGGEVEVQSDDVEEDYELDE